jgi:4-alpha-glucanotransferase
VKLPRSSGIVLHPTSLPAGRLGADAFAFVDWLEAAGQSWWQMLPLGPPDEHGSPYASSSAFAASSSLLADPESRVTKRAVDVFRRSHRYWARDWEEAGGDLADQVRFEREWSELRRYALERGVRLIGDVPIYPAHGSVDHRTHPELFLEGLVAGAPPDALGPEGQLWGNPLFDWARMAEEGYRWWIERLRRTFELFDLTRIDHFRGFASYWAVPEKAATAKAGHWEPGPGAEVFRAAEAELGPLPVIAEDLGLITPDVVALRDELGFPGMVVLLWAFSGPKRNPHRLENHREHAVVYTSTHDTDTLAGAFPRRNAWRLLETALSSRASLAMAPAQDVLGLGSEARMNTPGRREGNWGWRLEPEQLTDVLAARLRDATAESGRLRTGRLPIEPPATLSA